MWWSTDFLLYDLDHHIKKPTRCVCENKYADQLCSNHTAYQRIWFRYEDSAIPRFFLTPKFQASLYQACSDTTYISVIEDESLSPTIEGKLLCMFSRVQDHLVVFQDSCFYVSVLYQENMYLFYFFTYYLILFLLQNIVCEYSLEPRRFLVRTEAVLTCTHNLYFE